MTTFPFPELESDAQAIADFVAHESGRIEQAFPSALRAADEAALRRILEAPEPSSVIRRGTFLYDFRRTAEHPRGLWLRLPAGITPLPEAPWQTVFDVDAFCAETGRVWVWQGAETSPFHGGRALIRLSDEGSDMQRYIEFDLDHCSIVPGGFDVGPDRGDAKWAGPDSLLLSSAAPGDETRAGWSGALRRLERGMERGDAPLLCRTDPDHLLIEGRLSRLGGAEWVEVRVEHLAIGKQRVALIGTSRPPVTLPNPEDTSVSFNHAFCAWVANEQGAHPGGALVLCRHDGSEARELFTPEPGSAVRPDDVFFAGDWLIWIEMRMLSPHVMALDTSDPDAGPHEILPPVAAETVGVALLDANGDMSDGTLTLSVTGYLTPQQTWLFDLSKGVGGIEFRRLLFAPQHFDSSGCKVVLWTATSEDGAKVPYHVVLPEGHEERSDIPVLLYGYGGFGISLVPQYTALIGKDWVESGGAYVEAHIRGGGEFGPDWHNQAKGEGRHRGFADFAAVAADLVARGVTTPGRIACHGASNGGLLCGVMLTRYPERFGAVWASVGVYDMLRFAEFPAGRGWIDEYGDPDDPAAREWLQAYSPLHNVPGGPLPPALIDTTHRDDRVDPSHSRRFVAALRSKGHDPYYAEHRGGHGGGGSSHETAREMALGFAFLRRALRVGDKPQ